MCEVRGIKKSYTYLYHKCHINKVMAGAFTSFAFDSSVKNGGHGVKIGLYRVQAARVAQRDVCESRIDENGRCSYDGSIVRIKGNAYLVDCNVTGSDEGTSNNPKLTLMALFCDQVFPRLQSWCCPAALIVATCLPSKVTIQVLMLLEPSTTP
jgi:hypothetical protein